MLRLETLNINGSAGSDTVDIPGPTSEHRVVFTSNGGTDTVVGAPRPQEVFGTSDRLDALTDMTRRAAGSLLLRASGSLLHELTCLPLPWPNV